MLRIQKKYLKIFAVIPFVGFAYFLFQNFSFLNYFGSFTLFDGQSKSADDVQLILQGDGKLIINQGTSDTPRMLWMKSVGSHTCLSACTATFEAGNISLKDHGIEYWNSRSHGSTASKLFLSNQYPYLSIIDNGNVIWSAATDSGTPCRGESMSHGGWNSSGFDGQIGLANGDKRFLCSGGRWFDCNWEKNEPNWETKVSVGQTVGNYTCSARRNWTPANNCTRNGFDGTDDTTGIPNGDTHFLCLSGNWYDCGADGGDPTWETKTGVGGKVGNWTCSAQPGGGLSWVSGTNCKGGGLTGLHNQVGLSNGDSRFLCLDSRWYDCNWSGNAPSWETKIGNGDAVQNWRCDFGRGWTSNSCPTNLVWPDNAPVGKRANSDPWIVQNHACISKMRPVFWVINFANGSNALYQSAQDQASHPHIDNNIDITQNTMSLAGETNWNAYLLHKSQKFIDQLATASVPYRGSEDQAFFQPVLGKMIYLQDNQHGGVATPNPTSIANSDLFPRGPRDYLGRPVVDYYALMTDNVTYGPYWGLRDPLNPARWLSLKEIIDKGIVHDVIIMANQVDRVPATEVGEVTLGIMEVASIAQRYDTAFNPIPNQFIRYFGDSSVADPASGPARAAINSLPWFGRSLRVFFANVGRGNGCTLHNLGHDFEYRYANSVYQGMSLPGFQSLFSEYAGFDYGSTFSVPFSSLYDAGNLYQYSGTCSALDQTNCSMNLQYGNTSWGGTIPNYKMNGCGNVHFPPGAQSGYDYHPNSAPILEGNNSPPIPSKCETFHWPGSQYSTISDSRWNNYDVSTKSYGLVDCGGDFLTYWFQNMPNYHARALDANGQPMKNWWPYMYY